MRQQNHYGVKETVFESGFFYLVFLYWTSFVHSNSHNDYEKLREENMYPALDFSVSPKFH